MIVGRVNMSAKGPDFAQSALIIVDMQNDFVHPDGGFAHRAREEPEAKIDMPFLMSTIPQVKAAGRWLSSSSV